MMEVMNIRLMGGNPKSLILIFLILISTSSTTQSWNWFSSSSTHQENLDPQTNSFSPDHSAVAEFTVDGIGGDKKSIELVENAKNKMAGGTNSCWQNSYKQLFAACSQILAAEEKRSRFAWHLSDCFQRDSGRNPFPYCDTNSPMLTCLKKLSDSEHKVYLEFSLETNSICHQLQAHVFKHKIERLVNDLKNSAEYTEQQMEIIQEKTSLLSEGSNQIRDSLSSIGIKVENVEQHMEIIQEKTSLLSESSNQIRDSLSSVGIKVENVEQQMEIIQEKTSLLSESSSHIRDSLSSIGIKIENVDQTTKNVRDNMGVLSEHTKAVYEQSKEITQSQSELQEGQVRMNINLKEGMAMINDAYNKLGQQVDILRNEAVEIEKQIGEVGDAMSLKMQTLQISADDIENKTGKSLDKQQQLLDGQSVALKGLQILTEYQSEALDESRSTLQKLVEYGRKQQEELLQGQEQLQRVHNHLVENSESILAAQEAFESKQRSMFIALDKLFDLHNAMLLESRIIKAFLLYSMSIFIIYMFTSTKQTYNVRATLYVGLCATFLIEVAILRLTSNTIERQAWMINLVRSFYLLLASFQFLHAIYTYRDYEVLNHQMILMLMDKVNAMQKSKDQLSWEEGSYDDVNWTSWMKNELLEDEDDDGIMEDPDFIVPEEVVAENSITISSSETRKYDLRSRIRH